MRPEPAFETPWHAQVFALTVHLNETGVLNWPDWTQAFGATLHRHGLNKSLNGGDDYFVAWLETLEGFLQSQNLATADTIETLRDAWKAAYLCTPHGKPVHLNEERP